MTDKTNFFKLDRKIFNSDIWLQPVELRLFIYLIGQARHSKEPSTKYKNKGVIIERGQYLRSYRKLRDDLEYMENNAIKNYSLSRIKSAIDRLENQGRIKTEKTQLGTLFTVCNYAVYQGSYKNNKGGQNEEKTASERSANAERTESERSENNTKNVKNVKECIKNDKESNNIVPAEEVKKIYNSLPDYWTSLFQDYINIYRSKNKTGKITDNRHYKLLKEINQIFQNMKFDFDKQSYELTEEIFEKGLNIMIEKNVDNINYAKKVWISEIENEDSEEELEDTFTAEEVQEFVDKNL